MAPWRLGALGSVTITRNAERAIAEEKIKAQ